MVENKVINRSCGQDDFNKIISHSKKSLILYNTDKKFAVGTYVLLWETEGTTGIRTRRNCKVKVTDISTEKYLPRGIVVLSIRIATGGTHPQSVLVKLDWRNRHDYDQLKLNLN